MSENLHAQVEEQVVIHRILSNPYRFLILYALIEKEKSVSEIAETIGTSLQNTSQHLRLMKDKGIVQARREGQTIFYQVSAGDIGEACKQMVTRLVI